jgi:hypothetical protein
VRVLLIGDGDHERAGALQTLVERLSERSIDAEFHLSRESPRLLIKGDSRGYSWVLEAQQRGFDALVMVIDHDGYPERISEFNAAQDRQDGRFSLPRALGVAIPSFDAWMLADQTALASVLRRVIDQLSSPETLSDPKSLAKQVLDESPAVDLSQREFYRGIALVAKLDVLEQRCPKGFKPFADRVRSLSQ